jgi:hypothetical protein
MDLIGAKKSAYVLEAIKAKMKAESIAEEE